MVRVLKQKIRCFIIWSCTSLLLYGFGLGLGVMVYWKFIESPLYKCNPIKHHIAESPKTSVEVIK